MLHQDKECLTGDKAVTYSRVSSIKQTVRGDGINSQRQRCLEFARYKGLTVVEHFQDDISGSLATRPGMQAMLAYLRKHGKREKIVVIIDDISRLARGIEAHLKLRAAISAAGGILKSPSIEFGEDSDSPRHGRGSPNGDALGFVVARGDGGHARGFRRAPGQPLGYPSCRRDRDPEGEERAADRCRAPTGRDRSDLRGQTSGNGIDNFGVKGTTISACVINGCGAGGILWAGDCTDCNAVGCVCKNNVKSPTTTLHRGGITFHFSAGSTMRSVTLTGNICVDDQGPGAVSQFYAIGVVDDGGARSDISIDESNILRGYRLDGVENEQYIFERPLKVLTAFPQYVILDDQGEFFICSGSATCWATITQINNSQYAIVAPRTSNSPGKLLDTGNGYTTGTGYAGVTNTAVYRDATTNAVIARNMTGGPKAYRFALMQKR